MSILKAIFAVLISVSASLSLDITIRGTVTDTGITPLSGAVVKLEKYGLNTTTDSHGKFTLSGAVGINPGFKQLHPQWLSILIHNGTARLTVPEKTSVKIITYTIQGKAVSSIQKTLDAGTNAISLPNKGTGVYVYKITAGKNESFFKSLSCGRVFGKKEASDKGGSSSTVSAKRPGYAPIDDVIAVTKDGYLNYRVIVTNSDTSNIEIKMIVCADTVRDIDGNLYQAVRIGNLVWMAENLRVTKYSDGTTIPHVPDSAAWAYLTTPGYCFYNNATHPDTIKKWGALYNWHVVSPDNPEKIAPPGWRVPADEDWDSLAYYLVVNGYNWDETVEGNKIAKSLAGQVDWQPFTTEGTVGNDLRKNNRSGFSALPCGYRNHEGYFNEKSCDGLWWSATGTNTSIWYRRLFFDNHDLLRSQLYSSCGFSVRLVRGSISAENL